MHVSYTNFLLNETQEKTNVNHRTTITNLDFQLTKRYTKINKNLHNILEYARASHWLLT